MIDKGVDSHCHVFDTLRFRYSPAATYLPREYEAGTVEQFTAVLDAHRLSHALLVSPTSGYVYDNRCMLAAIRAGGGAVQGHRASAALGCHGGIPRRASGRRGD